MATNIHESLKNKKDMDKVIYIGNLLPLLVYSWMVIVVFIFLHDLELIAVTCLTYLKKLIKKIETKPKKKEHMFTEESQKKTVAENKQKTITTSFFKNIQKLPRNTKNVRNLEFCDHFFSAKNYKFLCNYNTYTLKNLRFFSNSFV